MSASRIFLFSFLLLSTVSFGQNNKTGSDNKTYCNARFGYCIDYPKTLYPEKESANGDGCVFINEKEEEILRVYGKNNLDHTLQKQFREDLKESQSDATITYRKQGKNFFVISGQKEGKIFYQKTIQKGNVFIYAVIEYNQNDKESYDKLSERIFASLR